MINLNVSRTFFNSWNALAEYLQAYAPVGTTDLFFESARKNYTTVL